MAAATRSANSGCVFRPVPTAVPPSANSCRSSTAKERRRRSASSWATQPLAFLSEGERHGVHEVGPADLDDARPGLGLGRQRVTQSGDGGDDLVDDGFGSSLCIAVGKVSLENCARLTVVVGAATCCPARRRPSRWRGWRSPRWRSCWIGCPSRSAKRAAGSGLQLPVDDLVGRGGDQVTDQASSWPRATFVRCGLLEDAKGADHAAGHGVLTDVEVDQRRAVWHP